MDNKKVLIIDDERFFIEPIKMFLEKQGILIVTAEDGITGLNLARSETPDAIILDLMLPVINGYQVCRLLKFDNQYRSIPVIIVSAKDTEDDRKLGEQSGADMYLTKPVDPADVFKQIQTFFKQS
ncbi:MAG: response regulator transcription factor [Fidelibacterota bacterium]